MKMNVDIDGILQVTAENMIGQSVSVLGIKGSGKSNTAAVLLDLLNNGGI